ncbi:MAG: S49 family peptidase [Candidatus Paceibacterota bacterium]
MWQKLSKLIKLLLKTIAVLLLIGLWSTASYFAINYFAKLTEEKNDCNISGISLHGEVVTYNSADSYNDNGDLVRDQTSADEVLYIVRQAQSNDDIKAIVVDIDSGGGYPEAGEEMMNAFKQSKKPVIAFIRGQGLSAAYLAATGAQTIFASKFSDIGSIGITGSYLQETEKNKKEGLTYIDLSSGKYKDTGNTGRALTLDEKKLFMRDINIMFSYFVEIVAKNRKIDITKVREIADGSSMLGDAALKAGLIDRIGLYPDVRKYLSEKIGTEAKICWEN